MESNNNVPNENSMGTSLDLQKNGIDDRIKKVKEQLDLLSSMSDQSNQKETDPNGVDQSNQKVTDSN